MTDYDKDILFEQDPNKDEARFLGALEKHYEAKKGDLRGIHFPSDFNPRTELPGISGNTSSKTLKLQHAVFHGFADFERVAFEGSVYFGKAEFREGASFDYTSFDRFANFRKATFCDEGPASFNDATFEGAAIFTDAEFWSELHLSGATFFSGVTLENARFRDRINFSFSTVENSLRANFSGARFYREAKFENSRFSGPCDFSKCCFLSEANFQSTDFEKNSTFSRAIFFRDAKFARSDFAGHAIFSRTYFRSKTSFYRADFHDTAFFTKAKFLNEESDSIFTDTDFFEGASFNQPDFRSKRVSFFNSNIGGTTSFAGEASCLIFSHAGRVDFERVTLSSVDKFSFIHADLSRATLVGTDMSNTELTGIHWARTEDGKDATFDEFCAERNRSDDESDWEQIEKLNRDLRLSFEKNRDFARAGRFHIREKEIQRTRTRAHEGYRTFLELYYRLSQYGENPWLPLVWLLFVFIASTLGYCFLGGATIWDSFLFSMSTTILRPSDLKLSSYAARIVHYFQLFISPILIGITGFAIRQRVKR